MSLFFKLKTRPTGQKGFTLIEIIVSIGIFAVVALVAIGAFLKIIDANKKAQTLKTSINNLNFALESISREMRVGRDFYCGDSDPTWSAILPLTSGVTRGATWPSSYCGGGRAVMAFRSSDIGANGSGTCYLIHAYKVMTNDETGKPSLYKAEQTSCGVEPDYQLLTAKDIVITSDSPFNVVGGVSGTVGLQPYAQINFQGQAGTQEKTKSTFVLQSTISSRIMDN